MDMFQSEKLRKEERREKMKRSFLLVFLLFLLFAVEITPVFASYRENDETRMYNYDSWFKIYATRCVAGKNQVQKAVCYSFNDSDGVLYSGCYPPGDWTTTGSCEPR
jgi:asparagine N-glycosylation enzyme membrane subunit Stt3